MALAGAAWRLSRCTPDERSNVVTLAGTTLRTSYFKPPDELQFVQSRLMEVDKDAPLPRQQSEALAWEAANEKARELGWIV
jgi:hypothetical protein